MIFIIVSQLSIYYLHVSFKANDMKLNRTTNNLSTPLYFYGKQHGYWNSYDEFFKRSSNDRNLVSDIQTAEITGMHPNERVMLDIEFLLEFKEAKRNEYINL